MTMIMMWMIMMIIMVIRLIIAMIITIMRWRMMAKCLHHDDVIKWKHFPHYWPFVRGIHRSPVNSLHKGQWHKALMFSLISAWINDWVNNREPGDLRCHHVHCDVTVMCMMHTTFVPNRNENSYWLLNSIRNARYPARDAQFLPLGNDQ